MNRKPKRHTVDVLFVITLFCVFAISVIMLTGIGANVYESIVDSMEDNYDSRSSFAYIINKVRQSDSAGNVSVGSFEERPTMIIREEINNITYCTYLYEYDGMMKELFSRADQTFPAEYGTDILAVASFDVEQVDDSLMQVNIMTKKGQSCELFVHVRSEVKK